MYQAFDATIDQAGNIRLDESTSVPRGCRAIVIVPDDTAIPNSDTALLSEDALARGWNRPEKDAAWAYLQSEHDSKDQADPAL
jgi:hypothetical protein